MRCFFYIKCARALQDGWFWNEGRVWIYAWKLSQEMVDSDGDRHENGGWNRVGTVWRLKRPPTRHKCRLRIINSTRQTLLIFPWTINTFCRVTTRPLLWRSWQTFNQRIVWSSTLGSVKRVGLEFSISWIVRFLRVFASNVTRILLPFESVYRCWKYFNKYLSLFYRQYTRTCASLKILREFLSCWYISPDLDTRYKIANNFCY